MTDANASMEAILAELAEVRASLVALHGVVEQQQSAIAALQQGSVEPQNMTPAARMLHTVTASADEASDSHDSASESADAPAGMTSRRNLIRGAAVATAATVGVAALGATQTAHAADGGNLIIGAANDETNTTVLTNSNSIAYSALVVNTTATDYHWGAIRGHGSGGATGIIGENDTNGIGVYGHTLGLSGVGVRGETGANGVGVLGAVVGEPGTGVGVYGDGFESIGVHGFANNGWGLVGEAVYGYDFVSNGNGIIGVNVQATAGAPTSGNFTVGDCIRDLNGDLWLCTATGNPGTWVMAAHVLHGYSGGITNYLSKPIRLFDSRPGATAYAAPGFKPSSAAPTSVQIAGVTYNGVTVPANITGAIGNLTVLNESGGGYIELVPSGAGFTGASNIAFNPGLTLANAYTVSLNQGKLDIILGGAGTVMTDVIIDLFAFVA